MYVIMYMTAVRFQLDYIERGVNMSKYQQLYADIKSLIIEIKAMEKEDTEKLTQEMEELIKVADDHLDSYFRNLNKQVYYQ